MSRLPHLTLIDTNAGLCRMWQACFEPFERVEIIHGRLQDLDAFDALVSPANSYGQMDGGVDRVIAEEVMPGVQHKVFEALRSRNAGYVPVGSSVLVATGIARRPWLVVAPTMRVPMSLNGRSQQVYDAFWSAVMAVRDHNHAQPDRRIGTMVCPGMGTGVGQLNPGVVAYLMAAAWQHHLNAPPPGWAGAARRERDMFGG